MGERQFGGMQQQPLAVELFTEEAVVTPFAIIDVANQGMKNMFEVAADLMATTGERFCFNKRVTAGGVATDRTGELD